MSSRLSMKMNVFWDVASCSLVQRLQGGRITDTYLLYLRYYFVHKKRIMTVNVNRAFLSLIVNARSATPTDDGGIASKQNFSIHRGVQDIMIQKRPCHGSGS
jgi:hypothetical protein